MSEESDSDRRARIRTWFVAEIEAAIRAHERYAMHMAPKAVRLTCERDFAAQMDFVVNEARERAVEAIAEGSRRFVAVASSDGGYLARANGVLCWEWWLYGVLLGMVVSSVVWLLVLS